MGTTSLKEIVYLLHSARYRFSSIITSFSYEADRRLLNQVSERFMKRTSAQQMTTTETDNLSKQTAEGESNYRFLWEVWWQKPLFWRMDRINLQNQRIRTERINRKESILYTSARQTHNVTKLESNELAEQDDYTAANKAAAEIAFLEPSFLLSSHNLVVLGSDNHARRPVYRVRARPRQDREAALDQVFWSSADSYELYVDAELGILLGYTGYIDDAPFAWARLEKISLNSTIPEEIFGTDLNRS